MMHKKYQIHEYKKINWFHYDTEIDNIYMKLRFQCSNLNADQFKFNFIQTSKCNQCNKNRQKTLHHYFMDCNKYAQHRKFLKQNITLDHNFQALSNKQLIQIIQGQKDNSIKNSTYQKIYQFIKLYIVLTGRFV